MIADPRHLKLKRLAIDTFQKLDPEKAAIILKDPEAEAVIDLAIDRLTQAFDILMGKQ